MSIENYFEEYVRKLKGVDNDIYPLLAKSAELFLRGADSQVQD